MKNKKLSGKNLPNKGYIIDSYSGPKELYKYFWNLTKRLKIKGSKLERKIIRQGYHHFLVHIYICSRLNSIKIDDPDKPITIPISSLLIRSKFKGIINVKLLRKKKMIYYTNHSHGRGEGRCREFRLHSRIYREAIQITKNYTLSAWEGLIRNGNHPNKVNIITGKPKNLPLKNDTFLYSNSIKVYDINPLIKNSINTLLPCPFNPHAIIPYFKNVKNAYDTELNEMKLVTKNLTKKHPTMSNKKKAKLPAYRKAKKKLQKIQGLYINIMLSLETIIAQQPQPIDLFVNDKQLCEYSAAYLFQKSGRVSETHGGFQNITTPCKKLLLQGVPKIYNYDLKNSQAVLLNIELKACGIKCRWLEKYIINKKKRSRLAKKVGISVSCWKSCFYSIVMGSPAGGISAVYDTIRKESKNKKNAKKILIKFKKVAKPLISACKQWRIHLFHSTDTRYKYKHRGYHWKNACGMTFREYLTDYDNDKTQLFDKTTGEIVTEQVIIRKVKRQLPAFFLQGKEAFYIHTLTLLCEENDIPVYKNEHDGLITGKEIPSELWKKVAVEVDAVGVSFEIKEICSPTKWQVFEVSYKKNMNINNISNQKSMV